MNSKDLSIGLMGDVMIGRSVDPVISREGFSYVWGDVLPILRRTDVNIINLETTLTTSTKEVQKVFNFKATPEKINSLKEGHITFANLANNHILDYSEEGLAETLHTLQDANIQYTGAGMNEEEAAKPAFIEKNGFRLKLLGLTDNEPGWKAGARKSGINYINVSVKNQRQKVLKTIAEVRKNSDMVIISIHWGPNMREEPSDEFIAFAHEMAEHGADIIHGHSAHIFQGIEVYHNKILLYDTGDFIDDYVVDPVLKNNHSFLFLMEVSRKGIERMRLIPVLISNYQVNLAKEKSYEWSIKRMQRLSDRFGTIISDTGEVGIIKMDVH
jgi:poly-gamma-glutamate capsule biosynthesis protein CapA/YwtB (metallophosphatase superfamily)